MNIKTILKILKMCFALKGKSPQFRWDTPFIASPQNEALFQFKILKLTGFLTVFLSTMRLKSLYLFLFYSLNLYLIHYVYYLNATWLCWLIWQRIMHFIHYRTKFQSLLYRLELLLTKELSQSKQEAKKLILTHPPSHFHIS